MKLNPALTAIFVTLGLGLTLASCAGNQAQTQPGASPGAEAEASPAITAVEPAPAAKADGHSSVSQGGQVLEVGPYHLELVPVSEATGVHLDFYLQRGDSHEAIPGARVTAQIQLPDGTQESLDLVYDADGGHYAALLPTTAPGEYQVAVLTDISGEKVNGRFNFVK